MIKTTIWAGSIRWNLNTFIVNVEIDEGSNGTYVNEIRNLYWHNETSKIDYDVINLFVDTLSSKDYDALVAVVIASYLETLDKGE